MTDPTNAKPRILIVDDELLVRNVLDQLLNDKYSCATANSAEDALSKLEKESFQLVLSDIDMGGMSGIEMIPYVHALVPDAVVVMISGKQTIESAISAMRIGAFDFIQKPFDLDHVEMAVERALQHYRLLAEKRRYENHLEELVEHRTAQLNYLAYHDALTDLPNRALFEDRLHQSLGLARHNENLVAVVLLSLDRFKAIHDTLGHNPGYELLRIVADRLKESVGDGETVARLERDEFALVLAQIKSTEDIINIVNEIKESFQLPVHFDGQEVFVTLSLGISLFPDDSRDADALLKNASAALSRAREQGGNTYQFYTADMNERAIHRLELENNLRRAIGREEFEVYYQPKIDSETRQISGMEALVRWRHPELGLISPAEFIPLAEETGLIIPMGEWILRTACVTSKQWVDAGHNLQLSVNLSAHQFQQNLLETVTGIIHETGFDPRCLELEVTESSVMKNAEYSIKILQELKKLGIKIAIDDFGTGYSSLGYLKKLPIDTLKIDKSFISEIVTNPDDAALVRAIIELSHNLRLKVIAEGVETEEQMHFLNLLRCDEVQGFLFSKPVASETFEKLLNQ